MTQMEKVVSIINVILEDGECVKRGATHRLVKKYTGLRLKDSSYLCSAVFKAAGWRKIAVDGYHYYAPPKEKV